jgi:hypothetical protein
MLIELAVPYADVCAGDLSLVLDAAPAPALEVLRRRAGGVDVELRLLGSSHQALVEGGARLSETVSCRPGPGPGLPASHAGEGYTFRARVERLEPAAYARRAAALTRAAAADPWGLAGVFPGPGLAFTALRLREAADGEGAAWTTWHGYPQTGELVVTDSVVRGG